MTRIRLALLASIAFAVPMTAQAAIQGSQGTNGLAFLALTSTGFAGATLSGGTVYTVPYDTRGEAVTPAGTQDKNYLAAGFDPNGKPAGSATLDFSKSNVGYLSFRWGSPDLYNTLSIVSTTGTYNFVAGATTSDGTGLGISSTNGNASFSQYVQFLATSANERILSATFTSVRQNAFEVSDFKAAAVPGPIAGAGLPALLALSGALFLRRRKLA